MYKIVFITFTIGSILSANIFTVTDKKGNVIESKSIKHIENCCLNQKATEYSQQAIYDELHKEENLARMAAMARQRLKEIKRVAAKVQKTGKTYHFTEADKKKLLDYAKYFKGGKYVWGGTSPKGFDCSGYVQYLYKKHNINLPRTALGQSKKGISVSKEHLQKGDLLFFLTDKKRGIPVTHVGIYLGNGEFIHAASKKKGIIISPITHGYYAKKFVSAKRVLSKT
jgi:cell wall-associated NlpC family hydrolase